MSSLVWQEVFLIILVVAFGMLIGFMLRRYFATKPAEGRGTAPRRAVAERAAAEAAALATASSAPATTAVAAQPPLVASQQALEKDDPAKDDLTKDDPTKDVARDAAANPEPELAPDLSNADAVARAVVEETEPPVEKRAEAEETKETQETKAQQPEPQTEPSSRPETETETVGHKPKLLDAPRGKPDDLRQIKGIGKVIAGKLNDLGVYHFEQIAAWSQEDVDWVSGSLSFKGRIERENWVEQAKALVREEAEDKAIALAASADIATDPAISLAAIQAAAELADDQDAKDAKAAADKPVATPAKDASSEDKADAAGQKPQLLAAPKGVADDLKKIKGIGKVLETKLNDLGVYHYDQIASWSQEEVDWVSTFLSFKGRIDREQWIEQAKALAKASQA